MTEVVAALIPEGGRFLICRRPADKSCALHWEFVGGKVEPGETPEQALARECREELGIDIRVGDIFVQVTHDYPDITVHLTLYLAQITRGAATDAGAQRARLDRAGGDRPLRILPGRSGYSGEDPAGLAGYLPRLGAPLQTEQPFAG